MRIPSGSTDRYIYFVAVDSADYATRETGLTTFTVYRSRNGGAAAAMTTPTINEVDGTNLPGVYELLLDEDTTLAAGNDTEEMVYHITQASMAPVTRVVEIYRPKATEGNTLGVAADGDISGNIDGQLASLATDSVDADALASDAVTEIQSGLSTLTSANVSTAVWDASVATYSTVGGSFGKSFKNLANGVISVDGSVNDASASASSFVTNLSSAVNDYYNDKILTFTSGSLIGQSRIIHDYVASTKTVSFDEAFTSAPADGDDFVLLAIHQHTLTQIYDAVATTQMTESYAGQGTAPTMAQAMFYLYQDTQEAAVSGLTKTIKKLDQSTTAATVTLDDASEPTSVTRAT